MSHPADRVYRFNSLSQWAQGSSTGLVFGEEGEGVFKTSARINSQPVARISPNETITALATDPAGRPLWLTDTGVLWVMAEPGPVQIAELPHALARKARRLLWGQNIGWIVADGEITRLDVRTGNRLGSFAQTGWRVVDALYDRCDGAIVVEVHAREGGTQTRLREIRSEGHARVLLDLGDVGEVLAAARFDWQSPIHVIAQSKGWQTFEINGHDITATHNYPDDPVRRPARQVAMTAQRRMVIVAPDAKILRAAFGLLEPVQEIDNLPKNSSLIDLLWASGTLYAATASRVYALLPSETDVPARTATYLGPVLHSPIGDRSGWLRADVSAEVPAGARVILRHRAFDTPLQAATYRDALRDEPDGTLVCDGWADSEASTHFGTGDNAILRHYLGQVAQEYLALRIDISLPTCAAPLSVHRMSVYYPNRSLIDELPAIYRGGDPSERQMRRMLAPFQALADEIDDLIGNSVRRVDPATADDLWTGFLLHWLGHEGFVRLDPARRRGLLQALPEVLRLRGTVAGLARVLDELAPQGYSIEDDGLSPDVWVLPDARDPAGSRLGRETRAARHAPQPLTLGGCLPLGDAVLKHACFDPASIARHCHGRVTVHIYGGDAAETALAPFTDRILRAFVPAHTHISFQFGATRPTDALERSRGLSPDNDQSSLITLNTGTSRTLNEWRLPDAGKIVRNDSATLDSAVLDGALILQ